MSADTYVAEFIDGPLDGEFAQRALVDGEPEPRVSVIAAIEGLESIFWYDAVGKREADGQWRVQFRFDAGTSDPVEHEEEHV